MDMKLDIYSHAQSVESWKSAFLTASGTGLSSALVDPTATATIRSFLRRNGIFYRSSFGGVYAKLTAWTEIRSPRLIYCTFWAMLGRDDGDRWSMVNPK